MDNSLLDILVCPVTHSKLRLETECLVADKGGLRYPIQNGIPVLLPHSAQLPPDCASLDAFKAKYRVTTAAA